MFFIQTGKTYKVGTTTTTTTLLCCMCRSRPCMCLNPRCGCGIEASINQSCATLSTFCYRSWTNVSRCERGRGNGSTESGQVRWASKSCSFLREWDIKRERGRGGEGEGEGDAGGLGERRGQQTRFRFYSRLRRAKGLKR